MIRLVQRKLIIPRGDTGFFNIPALATASQADVAVFTILDCRTKTRLFQKTVQPTSDVLTFEFTHNDTVNLAPGRYVWDIKLYKNPQYADEKLIDGEEIDSYYAGFNMPECEIRETGDDFLVSPDAATGKLAPEELDIISAAIADMHTAVEQTETNVTHYPYVGEDNHWYVWDATTAAFTDTGVKAIGQGVPAGGTAGQLLKKASAEDYDTEWTDDIYATRADTILETTLSRGRKENTTIGAGSFAFGTNVEASEQYSLATGVATQASGVAAQASGYGTKATGVYSHAEGSSTTASGSNSHAEGANTQAKGISSHVEGSNTVASAYASHVSGTYNVIDSFSTWPEWVSSTSYEVGDKVKVTTTDNNETVVIGYICKTANSDVEFTAANWTVDNMMNFAEIVGNGSSATRSNARALDWYGNEYLAGNLYVGANNDSTGGNKVLVAADIAGKANSADLAAVATSGSYSDLSNKPFIPTAVSDLTDDSGHYIKPAGGIPAADLAETYLTEHQDISGKVDKITGKGLSTNDFTDAYKTKLDNALTSFTETDPTVPAWAKAAQKPTYTAAEVGAPTIAEMNAAISNINTMRIHICTAQEYNAETGVPTIQNPDTQTFYLVPGGDSSNLYIEWAYVNNAWERFGSADVDLSGYALKTDTVLDTTLSRGRKENTTTGNDSIAFGNLVTASGYYSQAVGSGATASGTASHAEGLATTASGTAAHAEGWIADATGDYSHAEGRNTTASGEYSHTEGHNTTASNTHAHAEGNGTEASGISAHAEGSGAKARGNYSHAEGRNTIANGEASHVSGAYNAEDTYATWPEWVASTEYAVGDKVKVTTTVGNETTITGYKCKTANNDASFTSSKWIKDISMNYAEIIGNGTDFSTRSNARALDWDGNEYLMGDVYVHANADSSGGTKLATISDIPSVPVQDVQVNGTSVVTSGVANVPKGTNSALGVLKTPSAGGTFSEDGAIYINAATSAHMKAGTQLFWPVTPGRQHESTFYGLAKAAGDTTQSASANAVGTYTDSAKTSIRMMLGATSSDIVAVQDTQPTAADNKVWIMETAPASVQVPTVSEMNSALSGKIDDVQINGTSLVNNGVATIPIATENTLGVLKSWSAGGISANISGQLYIDKASSSAIKTGTNQYKAIVPYNQHESAFYALAKAAGDTTQSQSSNAVGIYTDNAKASIKSMLGIVDGSTGTVDVSGTTPTITAVENTRYICGEIATLSFTPPANGISIVRFTSGTTATILTLPSTVKFPEWFDATSLEADTIYEICVTDGVYGAVMSWAL